MAQDILSEGFALEAGLAVGWFDEATQRYYIDQDDKRFLAAIVDGQLQAVSEIKRADGA